MTQNKLFTEKEQSKKRKWRKEQIFACIIASIPLLGFVVFNGFPLLISFIGMFCNVDLYDLTNIQWNNFEGFKSVFIPGHDYELFYFDLAKYFYKAVIITAWIASTQLVTLAIALFIATLLHQKPKGAKTFQVLFFVPYICSTVAVSLMWRWMFAADGGILNAILGTDIDWLRDPKTITWTIIAAVLWQAPGYGVVMYKAAFTGIDKSLYEAADVDGANALQKFWNITLPGISPTTFFLLQAGAMAGLLTYDLAVLIIPDAWGSPGGVDSMGLTLIRLVYYLITNSSTSDANGVSYMVSCACVISWMLFIVTGTISMIMFRLREKSLK